MTDINCKESVKVEKLKISVFFVTKWIIKWMADNFFKKLISCKYMEQT